MATKSEAKRFLKLLDQAKAAVPANTRFKVGWSVKRRRVHGPRVHEVINNIAHCVVPRFVPVLKSVTPDKLDRKGGLIGGCGFVSESYPSPDSEIDERTFLDRHSKKKVVPRDRRPMAPLIQLDLDQIRAATGENVGRGLLQVWLPWKCWGQGERTYCRTIPRSTVSRTKNLKACRLPAIPLYLEEGYDPEELEVLDEVDPEAADEFRFQIKYWGAVSGFEWKVNEEEYGKFPKQIVGWKQKGYVLPRWDDDVNYLDSQGWGSAADYLRKASEITESELYQRASIALFEDESDDAHFWSFGDQKEPAVVNGWRPLFCFHGPVQVGYISDSHFVMFRRQGSQFEYASACTRWKW